MVLEVVQLSSLAMRCKARLRIPIVNGQTRSDKEQNMLHNKGVIGDLYDVVFCVEARAKVFSVCSR